MRYYIVIKASTDDKPVMFRGFRCSSGASKQTPRWTKWEEEDSDEVAVFTIRSLAFDAVDELAKLNVKAEVLELTFGTLFTERC